MTLMLNPLAHDSFFNIMYRIDVEPSVTIAVLPSLTERQVKAFLTWLPSTPGCVTLPRSTVFKAFSLSLPRTVGAGGLPVLSAPEVADGSSGAGNRSLLCL